MNFLIITDYFSIGGNTTYIMNVRKALERAGHRVVLITFKSITDSVDRWHFKTDHYDIFIKDFQFRYYASRVIKLHQLLKQLFRTWRPDAVISDLCLPAGAFLLCTSLFPTIPSIPFLYQFVGSNTFEKKSGMEYRDRGKNLRGSIKRRLHILFLYLFEKAILNHVSAIIIFSDYSKILLNSLKVNTVIYKILPGSDNAFRNIRNRYSKQEAKRICGVDSSKKMVLVLSRLEPRKGVLNLLDAFASHRTFLLSTHVVLCSQFDTYFSNEVLKQHSRYAFSNSILLVNNPTLKDRALLYRAADVVIIPSLALETFGFVALESYATGTPVVAYNTSAFTELIDKDCLVKPIGDGNQLLQKAMLLLSLPEHSLRSMSLSLVRYTNKYSWGSYVGMLMRIVKSYQKIS